MNKCKFKQHQHVVAVVNGNGVTQGNMYVVEKTFSLNTSDIPYVATIGDKGFMVYNYQTMFREAKIEVEEMSVEDATLVVEAKIDGCYDNDYTIRYFEGSEFITKLKTDKELQKALLILIGEGKQ